MSVLNITPMTVGAVGVQPGGWQIFTDDTFATVTATGYLSSYQSKWSFTSTQFAFVYTTDLKSIPLQITVSSSGVVTLVAMPAGELTGTALTKTNDTNVTLTLGGSPTTALVNAASLTLGWTGQLGVTRGGTGLATTTINQILYSSAANTIAGISTGNNGVLITSAGGAPSISSTLPSGIAATNMSLTTPVLGVAAATSVVLTKVNGTESSNAVTASGAAGVITTSALTTAGGSTYSITWTNTLITSTSVINLTIQGGTNSATNNINFKVTPGSGSATLVIYNNTAATALNGTLLIGYNIC